MWFSSEPCFPIFCHKLRPRSLYYFPIRKNILHEMIYRKLLWNSINFKVEYISIKILISVNIMFHIKIILKLGGNVFTLSIGTCYWLLLSKMPRFTKSCSVVQKIVVNHHLVVFYPQQFHIGINVDHWYLIIIVIHIMLLFAFSCAEL